MQETVAIILAAGISSRMNTKLPKVLHRVCGKEILAYVLDACRAAGIGRIYVIVGYGAEQVQQRFNDCDDITWVRQDQQKGTAHAVLCCKDYLKDFQGRTFVLCGDGPLIRPEVLQLLIKKYQTDKPAAVLATAVLEDPTGYGRVIRDETGQIKGIVEHSDCTEEQLKIKEVNPSYYLFNNRILFESLDRVRPDNAKGEYYLTDVLGIMLCAGHKISAVTAVRAEEAMSINDRQQLATVNKVMQSRIQQQLMDAGVTIVSPENTWIETGTTIGQDTVIEPFTYICSGVKIGQGCRIGPFVYLPAGTKIGDGMAIVGLLGPAERQAAGLEQYSASDIAGGER